MKKYELVGTSEEISYKDRLDIKAGCTISDEWPELISEFDSPEDAEAALSEYSSSIEALSGLLGTYYLVKEYSIREIEYDADGEIIEGCSHLKFSEMAIEVVEKPSYDTIAVVDNFKDAEEIMNLHEGDEGCFLSFGSDLPAEKKEKLSFASFMDLQKQKLEKDAAEQKEPKKEQNKKHEQGLE